MKTHLTSARARKPGHRLSPIALALAGMLAPLALDASIRVPPAELKPFVIDHRAGLEGGLDLSFLLEAPAGRDGFITRRNDHLVKPSGERVRLWGVNITDWTRGSVQIPSKEEAPIWAQSLARFGINVARLTFLDFTAPRGLIAANRNDTRALDEAKLDDFDFWVAELKKRGIYVDINLVVGRTYKEGDGVEDHTNVGWAKALTYFDPRLIELQKEFARQLLTHRNPYTKNNYANEPAVAIVELVNENSLWDAWYYDRLHPPQESPRDVNFRPTPPSYAAQLDDLYNAYLRTHLRPDELAAVRREAGVNHSQPVPRLRAVERPAASKLRLHAEAAFIIGIEQRYFREMRRYLRDELGVKSLLLGSNDYLHEHSNYGMVLANTELDFTDGHVYWQHPNWEGEINSPMVNKPDFSTVVRLSRTATTSRPYVVTEVNNAWPNDWDCEGIPIAAAYGAFQDWSAIMLYTFEPKPARSYRGYVGDAFDISHHPVKMPQMMAGALMYLRGDISAARETVVRTYSREQVLESIRLPIYESPYYTPGFPLQLVLKHRMRIGSFDGPPTAAYSAPRENPAISDTGELAWHTSTLETGLVTADAPRSQALIGFVQANEKATSNLAAAVTNNFCAITLSSLDNEPIAQSSRLLLTAGSRVQNTGFRWNENRTDAARGGRGEAPSLIEVVTGTITLRDLKNATSVVVQPLDGAGKPLGEPLPARNIREGWQFSVGDPATTWFTIHVTR
jgi:hypothetical protein